MFISLILAHPSLPPSAGEIVRNEGPQMRLILARAGIPTPKLVSMGKGELVEEYVEGGDLYRALAGGASYSLALEAGRLTALAHSVGLVFTDNKAQNFLVRGNSLLRTDLGFIQKSDSLFARSMDVGSFLASVVDLRNYRQIEAEFFKGYRFQMGKKFPYLSLILRNILAMGFSSNGNIALRNISLDSSRLLGY
jgi:tRNA A-37 threonylcarbamoyl transferase component Bud32